jgi:hypothetical protein
MFPTRTIVKPTKPQPKHSQIKQNTTKSSKHIIPNTCHWIRTCTLQIFPTPLTGPANRLAVVLAPPAALRPDDSFTLVALPSLHARLGTMSRKQNSPMHSALGILEIPRMNGAFATVTKLNDSRAESMAFHCPGCQTHPSWYRRDQLIVMGCPCGAVALDYAKLPFFPQTDREWIELLSEARYRHKALQTSIEGKPCRIVRCL